ncbi:hypothetical protein K2173_023069 [Erythroxylum novogranatense]|uniref:Protein kinase domain-containing protein n=1 Tax=Erythroxylum novogranatense TaxID=1862640 RepID=A0AAV8T865_9ROSI|nr:hypothetical protein K2173_023069 [Erythroxylum novogranatense]
MKMLQPGEDDMAGCGGSTVIVGVKLDSPSRELLTWAMVKVARAGDTVVAVHVIGNDEILDREGRSSLLSLVKAFDSVLAVFEGFCNLKQVDLKINICRGSSVRKILVREAKSYKASKLIVGAVRTHCTIRWSTTCVAKYCAKKLSKDCSVLAVNNGKVLFHRERCPTNPRHEDDRRNGILEALHRSISLSKNTKVLSDTAVNKASKCDQGRDQNLELALIQGRSNNLGNMKKQSCSICGTVSKYLNISCKQPKEDCHDNGNRFKSLAIVTVHKADATSSSRSLIDKQLPELKPGWPLLRCACLPDLRVSNRSSVSQISVVQWAMRLPSRQLSLSSANLDQKQTACRLMENVSTLDGESGAIVPVGTETVIYPPSSDHTWKSLPKELEGLQEKYSTTCRLFTYQEVLSATSNFLAETLIGKGGSSQVYKGCLPDGEELAVKILKPSEDVLKEFVSEIEIITSLHHKNIISLLGFCFDDKDLILVYDFLSRGSLEENLHGDKKDPLAFGWRERHKVAVGVAEALSYLHNDIAQPVIHRDVKSSNILLSDNFEPQLSDFGFAKWMSGSNSHMVCNDVAGTFGYLAPEYFMYGKVSEKIDVYAFGVVILELLSGRKPISNVHPKGQESLVMWAKPILNDEKISQLLDPSLSDNYEPDQMERMILAATLCIRRSPRTRPQMSIVLKILQGDAELIKWARLQVNAVEELETLDDETCPPSNLHSHLNLALLDVEDDSLSMSSIEQNMSLEDYLQGRCRWSRSSSFD